MQRTHFGKSWELLRDFEDRASLPNDGFFTDDHAHETVVGFDTQLAAENVEGDAVTLGDLTNMVITDPDTSTRYLIMGWDNVNQRLRVTEIT